ncbi:ABC transporter ATP-binding protein, partial [Eggerthella sinensis]
MIEFQQVSFAYRRAAPHEAPAGVRDVDLRVDAGTCVLVCGGSGCGKTTVTRLANGLAPSFIPGALSGRVLVDGRDMADLRSWEVAAHVGSVFQNPRTQFFNVDSTGEVAFALESMAWPEDRVRARVHETMDELGLRDLADRDIFSLSGGEKQRIAYASVWAPHPANLVLDEPTSNLDGDAIDALRGYLRAARARGTAVLVAEHRLWWLAETVDEVVYLRDGRVDARFSGAEFRALPAARL